MQEHPYADAAPHDLLVWCLAVFQTSGLVMVLLLLDYRAGGLSDRLDGLNTLVGFALFGALLAITYVSTRLAAQKLPLEAAVASPLRTLRAGVFYGGVNGVLVVIVATILLIPVVVYAQIDEGGSPAAVLVVPVFGAVAAFFACAIGAVIGLVFGLIESAVLYAARALLQPQLAPRDKEPS